LEILVKNFTVTRAAVLAAVFAFLAAPAAMKAATSGPGGGIPVPIGQNPVGSVVTFGPGGGIPVPIGQCGSKTGCTAVVAFGPGGGIPVPIGQNPVGSVLAFGPGGGIPCPIGHGKGSNA
jgi:hypothetical protein